MPANSPTHQPVDTRGAAIMVLLCLTWGLQQIALKAAAPDIAPTLQIGLRSGLSALMVAAVMRARGEGLTPGLLRPGLVVGLLFGLEFILVGEGLRRTSAAHMAVFLYTAPIFAPVGLHLRVRAERLRPRQWAGIALAFAGIAAAFLGRGPQGLPVRDATLLGDALAVAAGAAWGLTTVVVRGSALTSAPATETLLYQLVGAFALLLPTAMLTGQLGLRPTPLALGSLAFQTVLVSFASYLTWFWLLRRYVASRLGVFSFLTPLFGVAFGVWLLHEPVEPAFGAGAVLVLAGIVLVSAPARAAAGQDAGSSSTGSGRPVPSRSRS